MKINKNGAFGIHNTTKRPGKIEYIVIHYVGALGDAKDNVNHYNKLTTTNASADFFVGHKGDIRQYNGLLYRCAQPHTSQSDWTPTAAASLWTRIADPTQEWPEWIQPTGVHDAYAKGAKVSHNGKHYVSTADANVWEPGVYGWTEVTE